MAGPWVDDAPGHGFFQLSYSRYQADDYFSGPGETDPNKFTPLKQGTKQRITVPLASSFGAGKAKSNYIDQSMALYGEVSLWKGLGAVLSMPVLQYVTQDVNTSPNVTHLSQLNAGDLTFGFKQQLPKIKELRGFAFGPQVFVTAPTGDQNGRAAYPKAFSGAAPLPLPTGNGTWDIEARGAFGYSFYPIPVFLAADVGFRHRLDKATCRSGTAGTAETSVTYSDDLPWDVQAGGTWDVKKKWFDHAMLIANLGGLHSFENNDVPGKNGQPGRGNPFTQTCGQANNASSLSFGGTLMLFPIKQFGISYSISHTLTGENVGYGLTNTIGIASAF